MADSPEDELAALRHERSNPEAELAALRAQKQAAKAPAAPPPYDPSFHAQGGLQSATAGQGAAQRPDSGAAKAFAKEAIEETPTAIGGFAGASAAAPIGAGLGSALGPVGSFVGGVAGGIAGAAGAGALVEKTKDKILEALPENIKAMAGYDKRTRDTERAQHPYATFAGGLAPNLLMMRPGGSAKQALVGAGIGGGLEGGREAIRGDVDPIKIAMATLAGAAMSKPTKLGEKVSAAVTPGKPAIDLTKPLTAGEQAPKAQTFEQEVREAASYLKQPAQTTPGYVEQVEGIIRNRINNVAAQDRIHANVARAVTQAVPDPARRAALSEAIDLGNNNLLTPAEATQAQALRDKFAEVGQRAQQAGVLRDLRENYITHIVDWEKSKLTPTQQVLDAILGKAEQGKPGGSTSTSSRYAKGRKYDTFADLEQALQGSGLTLKTKDAAEIYQTYAQSMERAIQNKQMVEGLKDLKDANGTPLLHKISPDTFIPKGWQTFPQSSMAGYAAHPDLAPALKFVFSQREPGAWMKGAYALNTAVKRLNVMGSLFHANTLMQAFVGAAPGTAAKELVTGFAGTRAALEAYKTGGAGDMADKLLRAGLQLSIPEDVSRSALRTVGEGADTLMGKAGIQTQAGAKILGGVEKATLGVFDKVTWDFLHTGLKLQVASKLYENAMLKNPNADPEVLAREVSRFTNNTFGGLNWFDVATQAKTKLGKDLAMGAYSPEGRKMMQLLMFAPDWTISTARAFTTALPKVGKAAGIGGTGLQGLTNPTTQADLARRYQATIGVVYLTVLDGINYATSGHHIWENKDPTRIEFKDGTSMQVAKHAMEPAHWALNPAQEASNKLGFLPQAAATMMSGREYLGPSAPLVEASNGKVPSAVDRAKAVGGKLLPFQVKSAEQAPQGEELKRFALSTLGVPEYGMTEAQKAANREERKRRREAAKAAADEAERESR